MDIRAWPGSGLYPEFNAEKFAPFLKKHGIYHLCMGKGLGVRPSEDFLYTGQRVDYGKIIAWEPFQNDLKRLAKGIEKFSVCLMCKEKDPAFCHRAILVSWQFNLLFPSIPVFHILEDGTKITQANIDEILLKRPAGSWLFKDDYEKERSKAYLKRGKRIAWKKPSP